MADLNVWSVTGRLTKDAEYRTVASGKPLLTCDIAVNTGWGEYQKTTFARVQQWGERGSKLVNYLKKGKAIAVSGTLSINTWNKKDGTEVQQLVLDTNSIQLLSNGNADSTSAHKEPPKTTDYSDIDDVPF